MVLEPEGPTVRVSASELDLDALLAMYHNHPKFQDNLKKAAVLLLPTDLLPEYEGPVFPTTTPEVLRVLSENLDDEVTVDAAVLDEEYIEFEYRSEMVILPVVFVANAVLLPLVVNILGSYIFDRLKSRRVPASDATVRSQLHYERPDGGKFFLQYEGPAETFERVVLEKISCPGPCSDKGGPSSDNE